MYTDVIDVMHATPAWLLLSSAATRFVREHERPYPHRLHHIWRCNHCAQHFEKQEMQQDVVDHVKWVYVSISFWSFRLKYSNQSYAATVSGSQ